MSINSPGRGGTGDSEAASGTITPCDAGDGNGDGARSDVGDRPVESNKPSTKQGKVVFCTRDHDSGNEEKYTVQLRKTDDKWNIVVDGERKTMPKNVAEYCEVVDPKLQLYADKLLFMVGENIYWIELKSDKKDIQFNELNDSEDDDENQPFTTADRDQENPGLQNVQEKAEKPSPDSSPSESETTEPQKENKETMHVEDELSDPEKENSTSRVGDMTDVHKGHSTNVHSKLDNVKMASSDGEVNDAPDGKSIKPKTVEKENESIAENETSCNAEGFENCKPGNASCTLSSSCSSPTEALTYANQLLSSEEPASMSSNDDWASIENTPKEGNSLQRDDIKARTEEHIDHSISGEQSITKQESHADDTKGLKVPTKTTKHAHGTSYAEENVVRGDLQKEEMGENNHISVPIEHKGYYNASSISIGENEQKLEKDGNNVKQDPKQTADKDEFVTADSNTFAKSSDHTTLGSVECEDKSQLCPDQGHNLKKNMVTQLAPASVKTGMSLKEGEGMKKPETGMKEQDKGHTLVQENKTDEGKEETEKEERLSEVRDDEDQKDQVSSHGQLTGTRHEDVVTENLPFTEEETITEPCPAKTKEETVEPKGETPPSPSNTEDGNKPPNGLAKDAVDTSSAVALSSDKLGSTSGMESEGFAASGVISDDDFEIIPENGELDAEPTPGSNQDTEKISHVAKTQSELGKEQKDSACAPDVKVAKLFGKWTLSKGDLDLILDMDIPDNVTPQVESRENNLFLLVEPNIYKVHQGNDGLLLKPFRIVPVSKQIPEHSSEDKQRTVAKLVSDGSDTVRNVKRTEAEECSGIRNDGEPEVSSSSGRSLEEIGHHRGIPEQSKEARGLKEEKDRHGTGKVQSANRVIPGSSAKDYKPTSSKDTTVEIDASNKEAGTTTESGRMMAKDSKSSARKDKEKDESAKTSGVHEMRLDVLFNFKHGSNIVPYKQKGILKCTFDQILELHFVAKYHLDEFNHMCKQQLPASLSWNDKEHCFVLTTQEILQMSEEIDSFKLEFLKLILDFATKLGIQVKTFSGTLEVEHTQHICDWMKEEEKSRSLQIYWDISEEPEMILSVAYEQRLHELVQTLLLDLQQSLTHEDKIFFSWKVDQQSRELLKKFGQSKLEKMFPGIEFHFRPGDVQDECLFGGLGDKKKFEKELKHFFDGLAFRDLSASKQQIYLFASRPETRDYVNEKLKGERLECHLHLDEQQLKLVATSEQYASKGEAIVMESLLEVKMDEKLDYLQSDVGGAMLSKLKEEYQGKIIFTFEQAHVIAIGTDDVVKKFKEFVDSIVTKQVKAPDRDVYAYLHKHRKQEILAMAEKVLVFIVFEEKDETAGFILKGTPTNVQLLGDNIHDMLAHITVKDMTVEEPGCVKFFRDSSFYKSLEKVEYQVQVKQVEQVGAGWEQEEDRAAAEVDRRVEQMCWRCKYGSRVVMVKAALKDIAADVKVVPVDDRPGRTEHVCWNKVTKTAEMVVPYAKEMTAGKKDKMHIAMASVLEGAKKQKYFSIALDFTPVQAWNLKNYFKAILYSIFQMFEGPGASLLPQAVILCCDDDDIFMSGYHYAQGVFQLRKVEKETEGKESIGMKVRTVSGELNKAEVDVIVNTVSPNIDLSAGRVSKSLLESAGSDLQKECIKQRETLHGQVLQAAEFIKTPGYQLCCKEVYHGCYCKKVIF